MKLMITTLAIVLSCGIAHAEQTMEEKAGSAANTAGRTVKKGANRVKEMVCAKSDAKCLAEKAKHRVQEGGEAVSDKVKAGADSVDSNDNVNN